MRNVQHIVEEGDTLWDLSAKFLGDPLEWHRIYTYNNRPAVTRITGRGIIDPDLIYPGQKLLIPVLTGGSGITNLKPKSGFRPKPVLAQPSTLKELKTKTNVPFSIKYRLDDLPIIKSEAPGFSASIKLSGNVIVKLADMVPLGHVTNKGMEASLKFKTDHALGQLLSDTYVGVDLNNKITYRSMMVANSTTPTALSTAIGFAIASDKPVPVIRGEIRYPKLVGRINSDEYVAYNVKIVIEIEPKTPSTEGPEPGFRRITDPISFPVAKEAINEGIKWGFITGAALLIGTIASDILTGGIGLADDLVTIPLALSMMGVTVVAQELPPQQPIRLGSH